MMLGMMIFPFPEIFSEVFAMLHPKEETNEYKMEGTVTFFMNLELHY